MPVESVRSWLHTARVALRNARGRKREPEIEFLRHFVAPGATCLHVGASDGRHTYALSRLSETGTVHCFEPSPYTCAILRRLLRIHRLRNVRLHQVAIGSTPGETRLVTPIKRNGHLGRSFAFIADEPPCAETLARQRQFRGYRTTPAAVWTLDDYCEREGVARVDFVRCDVEGAELAVLRGACGVLGRDRPVLLLEIHPHALRDQFGESAGAVHRLLREHRYRLLRVSGDALAETDAIADEPWRDYYCVPDGHPFLAGAAPERGVARC